MPRSSQSRLHSSARVCALGRSSRIAARRRASPQLKPPSFALREHFSMYLNTGSLDQTRYRTSMASVIVGHLVSTRSQAWRTMVLAWMWMVCARLSCRVVRRCGSQASDTRSWEGYACECLPRTRPSVWRRLRGHFTMRGARCLLSIPI